MRFFLAFAISVGILIAEETIWVDGYQTARNEAIASDKIVYLLITTPQCRWCHKLKTLTLSMDTVQARLSQMAVSVEVSRGGEYPRKLKAPMVPMHYFLDVNEKVLIKIPGYWGEEDFMSILDDVERKVRRLRAIHSNR